MCEFRKMNLAIYGDSISTTEFGSRGYSQKLQDELGLIKVYNYAISATCLAATLPGNGIGIIRKKENRHKDADVVILWHGTNDWYFGNPLGDDDSMEDTTFCGALNEAIRLLKETNPAVKIILPTALLRCQAPDGGEKIGDAMFLPNKAGLTQREYIEAIKRIGLRERCTVIDMREKTAFTIQEQPRYQPDGVHPSADGYNVIVQIFAEVIKGLSLTD